MAHIWFAEVLSKRTRRWVPLYPWEDTRKEARKHARESRRDFPKHKYHVRKYVREEPQP